VTRDEIQNRLQDIFSSHLGASSATTEELVPLAVSGGKLYEAYVLSRVVERLALSEGYTLTLVSGTRVQLKSSPGPINRNYPRIELRRFGNCVAELWTDIEFLSLSYCTDIPRPVTKGDYHELDIVVVAAGLAGRPRCDQVWLGIECKNTGYQKSMLKEILGIRRELSFLDQPRATNFLSWPRVNVPANPPSCLVVYSTDANVSDYSAPGARFGIDFVHDPM
jgi:hypothetical protein